LREGNDHISGGWFKHYKINGALWDVNFRSMNEIPVGAKKVIDLSNGSYVECYIAKIENNMAIFRPNPNDKDIYKPLPLSEHIKIAMER